MTNNYPYASSAPKYAVPVTIENGGVPGGVASLDEFGKIPSNQLPDNAVTLGQDGRISSNELPSNTVFTGQNGKISSDLLPEIEVTPEDIANAVNDWLDEHPDATTTVEDDSITEAKIQDGAITESKLDFSVVDIIDGKAERDAYAPELAAGSADNIAGADVDESSWLHRAGGAPRDGVAKVESIKGRTVVWNQLVPESGRQTTSTMEFNASDYIFENHKYLIAVNVAPTESATNPLFTLYGRREGASSNITLAYLRVPSTGRYAQIFTSQATLHGGSVNTAGHFWLYVWQIAEREDFVLYDLTLMFGAGNEPATVEEFEAMFPENYYAYDAGSLLSVDVRGVESVGRNLLPTVESPQTQALAGFSVTANRNGSFTIGGTPSSGTAPRIRFRLSTPIVLKDGMSIKIRNDARDVSSSADASTICFWRESDSLNSPELELGLSSVNRIYTPQSGSAHIGIEYAYIGFKRNTATSGAEITISPSFESNPAPTSYVPYSKFTRALPVADYFPDGMKSAGNAYDELTAGRAVKRVGAVVGGELEWQIWDATIDDVFYAVVAGKTNGIHNIECSDYPNNKSATGVNSLGNNQSIGSNSNSRIYVKSSAFVGKSAGEVKTLVSGVTFYYELATPTVTEIDPPLNLTYRAEAGGTERAIVDEQATAPQSAPPTWAIAYGYTAEGLRDEALAVIAPVENHRASTNYAIGAYLIHGGTLYRVTTAIATGEAITPGTNVTATTVMAELIRLTA